LELQVEQAAIFLFHPTRRTIGFQTGNDAKAGLNMHWRFVVGVSTVTTP
jgi:hypothetical protein